MKTKLLALGAFLALCGAAVFYDTVRTPPAVAPARTADPRVMTPAPELSFTTVDGKAYTLNTLPEKLLIVHFWASWCGPCVVELPSLMKEANKMKGAVALVLVSVDDDRAAMTGFLDRLKSQDNTGFDNPSLYVVWDKDKAISLDRFGTMSVPETVFINAKRQMADKLAGSVDWDNDEIRKYLKDLAGS